MAQYFTDDFADWSTDWTERYNTGYWSGAVSGGDVVLPTSGQAADWIANTWNDVDGDASRADVDILLLCRFATFTFAERFFMARGAGADESVTQIHLSRGSSFLSLGYNSGSDTRVNLASYSTTPSTTVDTWIRIRLSASGSTTTYKLKAWTGAAGDEPGGVESDASWNLNSTTTAAPTAAGWVGFCLYDAIASSGSTIKQVGIGTGGDWGPSAAAGGTTSSPMLRAFPRPILQF